MARDPRNVVDPILGVTPAWQEKRWNEIFNSKLVKQPKAKTAPKRKVGVRQPKSNNSLKPQAIELFRAGKSVKQVSVELNITYANANYYKKFAV
jgi:hypothetical protein